MTYTQPRECEKCGKPIDQDNFIFCPDCREPETVEEVLPQASREIVEKVVRNLDLIETVKDPEDVRMIEVNTIIHIYRGIIEDVDSFTDPVQAAEQFKLYAGVTVEDYDSESDSDTEVRWFTDVVEVPKFDGSGVST